MFTRYRQADCMTIMDAIGENWKEKELKKSEK